MPLRLMGINGEATAAWPSCGVRWMAAAYGVQLGIYYIQIQFTFGSCSEASGLTAPSSAARANSWDHGACFLIGLSSYKTGLQ